MEWVNVISIDGVTNLAYQLWSPDAPTVRNPSSTTQRRCLGLVHRIGMSAKWRARVSGSSHVMEFEGKDEAMAWVEAQAKLMGFT